MKKAQLESANCCKLVCIKNLQQKEIPVSEMNITQCLFFPEQFEKPVVVKFDEPCSSSDGGALQGNRILGLSTSREERRHSAPSRLPRKFEDPILLHIVVAS